MSEQANYIPINIDMLRSSCPFTFDIYIKVNDKFLHYIRKGDDIEEERLDRFKQILKLKEKNVDRLFIPKEDRNSFDSFIDDEIEEAVNSEELEDTQKMDIVFEIASTAVEVSFDDPTALEAYELTQKAAKGLRKVVTKNPDALKKLFTKKRRETGIIQFHCTNVATIALKLAFSCGFRGEDLDNLGAAALVHDIGLKQMKQDDIDILFSRPRTRLKPNDKLIYQDHVVDGVQLLSSKEFVNPDIIALVEAHEEDVGGGGYPKKVMKLEPLVQILAIADRFDKKITVEDKDPLDAFSELKKEEIGNIDLKYFDKLKDLLKNVDLKVEK